MYSSLLPLTVVLSAAQS